MSSQSDVTPGHLMSTIKITRHRVFLQCPQRGRGGCGHFLLSHREIIYLPLTISLFFNYSTTQLLEFQETVGQARQRPQTEFGKEPRRAESKPATKAQYSDGLSDGQAGF